MPSSGKADNIEAYFDEDWAGNDDDSDKNSAWWGLMVGGCRLHSHSKTTGQRAPSTGDGGNHEHERVAERGKIDAIQSRVLWNGAPANRLAHSCGCCKSVLPHKRSGQDETS